MNPPGDLLWFTVTILCKKKFAHCSVHDACAMGPDGVGYVADVNGVQVLVV